MDESLLNNFISVTKATRQEAEFYLSSANNDLELAIITFFNTSQSNSSAATTSSPSLPQASPSSQQRAPLTTTSQSTPLTSSSSSSSSSRAPPRRSGMVTFSDLGGDEEGKDDNNSNRYYAGGSTTSGQQIIGRDDEEKKKGSAYANDLTSLIFKKAQENAEKGGGEFDRPTTTTTATSPSFSGSGYRLGTTPGGEISSSQASSSSSSQANASEEEKTVTITFYQDGFTIDDGELRRFDDPANQKFLEAINKGYVPTEVAGMAKEVLVNLVNKREEKFADVKKEFKAFGGEGRSLGAARQVPTAATSTPSTQAPAYSVDRNRPHTNIQIRLHDGTRLNATFNLDDTVKTLIQFVQASRPNVGNFQLMTAFPKKVLDNPSLTIEQAGLKNAAVIQNLV